MLVGGVAYKLKNKIKRNNDFAVYSGRCAVISKRYLFVLEKCIRNLKLKTKCLFKKLFNRLLAGA